MHARSLDDFRHEHVFLGAHHEKNERKTWLVIWICAATMVAEIVAGVLFHSMALLADGLHMSTHAGAMTIAALAYGYARRHARDERFSFGTGKLGDLSGFTSAVILALISLLIGYESVLRFIHPVKIAFGDAIPIAWLGLGVNLVTAWLLRDDHSHDHGHDHHGHDHHGHEHDGHDHHDHDHHHHHHGHDHGQAGHAGHHDLNLRAAYVHMATDAVVSVLAIVGLTAGLYLGWVWMDPLMGIAGAALIAVWSWRLMRATGQVLLDMQPSTQLVEAVRESLERDGDRVADLHVWRVGPGHNAAIATVVSGRPEPPHMYKARLSSIAGLSHVTVEVELCPGPHGA